jgi:DNA-binding MarR family transcriptional regulator
MSRARLVAESVTAQRALTRAVLDATLEDLLEVDITMPQLKALAAIQRQPECTIGMLSEQLGVKPPAASLLVDKLVTAGLARRERDRLDGRRVFVHPTASGGRLVARIREGARASLQHWIQQLRDDDLRALHRGTCALAEAAGAFVVSPASRRAGVSPDRVTVAG